MLGTGIEPAHSCEHMILNHARLPIPPPEQESYQKKRVKIKRVFLMAQGFHLWGIYAKTTPDTSHHQSYLPIVV